MLLRLYLILISIFYFGYADIIIDKNTQKIENFNLEYYYDNSRKLDIKDISKIDFKKNISNQFAFGYIKGNSWFKFDIENKSPKNEIILYLTEPFFEEVNLFENKNGKWKQHSNGLSISLENRDMKDINPAFIMNIEPNTKKTFYIQTFAKFAQFGEFNIYTKKESVTQYRLLVTALYSLFFGVLFFIIIFNIFLYFTLKDKIYIYYVGYILFHSIFVFAFSGLDIYIGLLPWHYELHLSIPVLIIFFILFSIQFLDIKKHFSYTVIILKSIIFIYAILTILTLMEFNPWYQIMTSITSFTYIILLYVSIRIWYLGNTKAKYYLLAMVIYIFSVIIMSSMINGWLVNNDITRYAFILGSLIEAVLFSLILANRFNDIQNDKLLIQKELLDIKNENEKFLENKVLLRTEEIRFLLNEKDLLLREIHHRVKNNFQMVISMLSLELAKYKSTQHRSSFLELINRIKSMSMVHQFLYDSNKQCQIKSEDYLLKIIQEVKKIYEKHTINIISSIDSYILTIDEAMVLGTIINEVLNNSIKHHDKNDCNISLKFTKINNTIHLIIKDDGIGFIHKKENKTDGLGLKLIEQFSKKLNSSKINFSLDNGTIFELTFKPQ